MHADIRDMEIVAYVGSLVHWFISLLAQSSICQSINQQVTNELMINARPHPTLSKGEGLKKSEVQVLLLWRRI